MTHMLLSNFTRDVFFASANIAMCILVIAIIFSPGFIIVGGFVALMARRKRQLAMRRAFMSTLAVAAERGIPLAPTIRACAAERGAWRWKKMIALAKSIESGTPLPDAFARTAGVFPADAMPVIQAGLQTGSLGFALHQYIDSDGNDSNIWRSFTVKLLWLTLLLIYASFIVVFFMAKIAPAIQKIFADFGRPLPPITQVVFGLSRIGGGFYFIAFWFIVFLLLLSAYSLLRYSGWISINPPGANRFLRRYDMATVLEAVALAVDRRLPHEPILATFAQLYPKAGIRRLLGRVCIDIRQGGDWCCSLTRHKLIKPADEAVLQSAARTGNLGWALRQLAGSQRRRFAYRVQTLVQVCFPPVVILVGIAVAIFVIGCFAPLVHLITALT